MFKVIKREARGYLSIEASFLLPLITLVIWFLIMIGFFLYNASYLHQTAYVAAVRGAAMRREGRETVEQETEVQIKRLLEDKLVMIKSYDYQVKVNTSHVIVTIEAKIEYPIFSFISEKLGLWKMKAKGSAIRDNPVNLIRESRK